MDSETTMNETRDEILEDLQERLAEARTRALMGEREVALGVLRGAVLEMTRFRDLLQGESGYHALEHALDVTLDAMNAEAVLADKPKHTRTRQKTTRRQAA